MPAKLSTKKGPGRGKNSQNPRFHTDKPPQLQRSQAPQNALTVLPPPPPQQQEQVSPPHTSLVTSRLCVKNVPRDMTVPKLKEHFAAKGEVTDVKILKTRDGQSRQMAFVGYKTSEDAYAAHKYFNNTFIYASRISVEFAVKYHDPSLARPWSKHSEGSSAQQRQQERSQQQEQENQERGTCKKGAVVDGNAAEVQALASRIQSRGAKGKKDGGQADVDPKLAEFLALMAPRNRAKLWSNDELLPQQTLQDLQGTASAEDSGNEGEGDGPHITGSSSDDEDYNDLGGIRDAKAEVKGSDDDDDQEGTDNDTTNKDAAVLSEGMSDLDYLKSRMRQWKDDDDDDNEDMADEAKRRGDQSGVSPSRSPTPPPTKSKAASKAAGVKQGGQENAGKGKAEGAGAMDIDGEGGSDEEEVERKERSVPPSEDDHPNAQGPQVVNAIADGSHPEDLIADTGRLFVRNLTYSATEADLAECFGQFGDVSEVHVVLDRETKRSKGIAYVLFVMPSDAVNAYQQLDGQIFQGRLMHILPANRPPAIEKASSGVAEEGKQGKGAGSSFKTEREQRRKGDAGNRAAWNSLFIRPDTVADAVAAHYGVSKSELMDAHAAGDLAVRMALGEAAVVAQTKTALAEEGVDVTQLEAAAVASGKASAIKAVTRSDRTMLVKNLPYSASEDELRAMFARCGPIARLVLPPSHALALVEYNEPQDARSAFKALAYKKYQHVPLYLEWAPKDIFSTPPPPKELQQAAQAGQAKVTEGAATKQPAGAKVWAADLGKAGVEEADRVQGNGANSTGGGEDDRDEDAVSTLYVKNLAFATTDAGLKKHFDKVVSSVGGTLHSARVARRKGPNGEMLSAGFGFVEVNTPDVAAQVIKQLQGSMLDNHKLSMQLSKRHVPTAPALAKGQQQQTQGTADGEAQQQGKGKKGDGATTKLLVRNVAFEATRKDILGLVSPFGHLKSCRLPKKYDGHHRGYAFVEFVTKQEARNALEGVGGVHLYGRRLVVEYAKDDEGLDDLRTKTASKYKGDDAEAAQAPAAKRLRKDL